MCNMEYNRLKRENCGQIVEFLDRVFTLHNGVNMNFKADYPRIFCGCDEPMSWHIAAVENGTIYGCAGNYPIDYSIGDSVLKIGAIENVAVDPSCRGRGLMQNMLSRLLREEDEKGFDMYHLLGDRWRYRNFGFERCGSQYAFEFTYSMLGKEKPETELVFLQIEKGDSSIPLLYELYSNQKTYVHIELDTFKMFFSDERRKYFAVKNKSGEIVGYLATNSEGNAFIDIALTEAKHIKDLMKCYFDLSGQKKIYISLPLYSEYFDFALSNAERYSISQPGCFRIVNFKKVTETFMREKSLYEYLPDGKVTIDSEIFGKWCIEKQGKTISVNPFDGDVDYILPGFSIYNFLFGTLRYKSNSKKDVLATAWFPLPLYAPAFR